MWESGIFVVVLVVVLVLVRRRGTSEGPTVFSFGKRKAGKV